MSIKDKINIDKEINFEDREETSPIDNNKSIDDEPIEEKPSIIKRILTAETGEKPLENYTTHALNFNKSKSIGKVIRGLEGLFGSLDLAIIDIVIGLLEYSKEKGFLNGKAGN